MSTDPAASSADASQLGGLPTVRLNLGSFNCGIEQGMLPKPKHQNNLRRVIAKAVGEQDLHMVNLCEVGAANKGWSRALCALRLSSPSVASLGIIRPPPAKHT